MNNVKEIKQWTRFLPVELKIAEDEQFIKVFKIVVPKVIRNDGLGTIVMKEIIKYASSRYKPIILTPSADFGGDVDRLTKWYSSLGFQDLPQIWNLDDKMYKTP
ncbi:MAG: hypothetical protein QM489_00860 [Candidatus Izemoplasma sp.]